MNMSVDHDGSTQRRIGTLQFFIAGIGHGSPPQVIGAGVNHAKAGLGVQGRKSFQPSQAFFADACERGGKRAPPPPRPVPTKSGASRGVLSGGTRCFFTSPPPCRLWGSELQLRHKGSPQPHCHSERSRPTFSSPFTPVKGSTCAERN